MAANLVVVQVALFSTLLGIVSGCQLPDRSNFSHVTCKYAPGLTVGSRQDELYCCNYTYSHFACNWGRGSLYLSAYLESLRGWNCPQFAVECAEKTYSFSEFSTLLYDRFCDYLRFENQCSAAVRETVKPPDLSRNFSDLIQDINLNELTNEQVVEPCIQVASYDLKGYGHFHEIVEVFVPFCPFVWCGFDEDIVQDRGVSPWTCMAKGCRANIIVIMVSAAILAVAIVIANSTVIGVLIFSPNMRYNQSIYRLSLAVADLLVGIIVFPTFISTLVRYFVSEHELGNFRNVTGYIVNDTTGLMTQQLDTVEVRGMGGRFSNRFSVSYLNFVGFFTILSLTVSVYTLAAAGIDRVCALKFPVWYKNKSKVSISTVVTVLIWVIAVVFSTLPFYVSMLQYGIVSAILVASAGSTVVILYIIMFLIPLLVMWSVSVAAFCVGKRYVKEWKQISGDQNLQTRGISEAKLARTLGVMVGVFTLTILPSVIVLVTAFFLPDVYPSRPKLLSENSATILTSSEIVIIFILMSNSLWNCFIYSIREQEFRTASVEMYSAMSQKTGLQFLWAKCRKMAGKQSNLPTMQQPHVSNETIDVLEIEDEM